MPKLEPGIRIDLDPTLVGVRRIRFQPEIKNTKAISVEKRSLSSLSKITSIQDKPVVYLLLNGNAPLYVGVSYSTQNRLRNHAANKKGWDRVLIFYSLSPSLNNSITGSCEHKLFSQLKNGGISLDQQNPSEISLSEDDSLIASSFFSDSVTIMKALGVDLEIPTKTNKLPDTTTGLRVSPSKQKMISDVLFLKAVKTKATGVFLDPEMRVEEGAIGGVPNPSLKKSESLYRTYLEMEQNGIIEPLEDNPNYWRLSKPYIFSSPSAAASILKGSPQNGKICWMNEKGVLLRDLIKKQK